VSEGRDGGGVRIAELVATLSYAADLWLGQPMDHCMRQTVIALRLADLVGVDDSDREAVYYVGLVMNAYCHADAAEQARLVGDDIAFKRDGFEVLGMNTAQAIAFFLGRLGSHGATTERARRIAAFPVSGWSAVVSFLTTHSTLGRQFVEQIGLGPAVAVAVGQAYEQWDGKGQPHQLRGTEICVPARLVQLAGPLEVFSRRRGVDGAITMARRNRAKQFDPSVVDLFCDHAGGVLGGVEEAATWDRILAAEPPPVRRVDGTDLDDALVAMADLVDLKSPYLAGHSRGVANLAAAAGEVAGFGPEAVTTLWRAGLVHDLGRIGVSNAIWDKAGPLNEVESERVRLHPYLTDRMLARVAALDASREIASRHHERLDGSGYPRGLTASSLTSSDRLLAAADTYHAMTEPRPHRPSFAGSEASLRLQQEARAGRLGGAAVNAVLAAAGHRAPVSRAWPAGLTAREVEVLGLLARGQPNKQIATETETAERTVKAHRAHIMQKMEADSLAGLVRAADHLGIAGEG